MIDLLSCTSHWRSPCQSHAPCQTSHPECIASSFLTRCADCMQLRCACMLMLTDLHVLTHVPHMAWLNLSTSSIVYCGFASRDDDEYHLPTTHDCITLARIVSCFIDASLFCRRHCMQAMHLQVCTTLMQSCRSCTKRPRSWCHVADQHSCPITPHGGQSSHSLSPKVSKHPLDVNFSTTHAPQM